MALVGAACDGGKRPVVGSPVEMLDTLSQGGAHAAFGGSSGTAIEKLVDARRGTGKPLHFDLRSGDAPAPLGDGTCENHVLVATGEGGAPFIGVRLDLEEGRWHIAGYWTPRLSNKTPGP